MFNLRKLSDKPAPAFRRYIVNRVKPVFVTKTDYHFQRIIIEDGEMEMEGLEPKRRTIEQKIPKNWILSLEQSLIHEGEYSVIFNWPTSNLSELNQEFIKRY